MTLFSGYRAAKDSSVDEFLMDRAVMMEKKQECRTYIAVDIECGSMLGFFTLATRCLEIPDECGLSNSMLRKSTIRMNVQPKMTASTQFQKEP